MSGGVAGGRGVPGPAAFFLGAARSPTGWLGVLQAGVKFMLLGQQPFVEQQGVLLGLCVAGGRGVPAAGPAASEGI